MKKMSTFIMALMATLYLTGCGSDDAELKELRERVNYLESIHETSTPSEVVKSDNESIQDEISTESSEEKSSEKTLVISSTSLEVPQISKENEDIMVTMFYCGNSFNCKVVSEMNLGTLPNIKLPFYGEEIRNVSLVISGVTVNAIYKVENNTWKQVENITFDTVDNTYLSSIYIDGSETNTFMIQTVNGNHYYVAIKY